MEQLTMKTYLRALKSRYLKGNRKTKKQILDEFCASSGHHRKSVIRMLTRGSFGERDRPSGQKKQYDSKLFYCLSSLYGLPQIKCAGRG